MGILVIIMYARTEFLYAVLLAAASFIEGSQASLQARATPSGNVSFFFSPVFCLTSLYQPLIQVSHQ